MTKCYYRDLSILFQHVPSVCQKLFSSGEAMNRRQWIAYTLLMIHMAFSDFRIDCIKNICRFVIIMSRPRCNLPSERYIGQSEIPLPSDSFLFDLQSRGTSERSPYGKQRICRSNSGSAHFHVSWLSDFIFYPKPLYKSLHQSCFYSFTTILPSESGVALDYSMILPQTLSFRHLTFIFEHLSRDFEKTTNTAMYHGR